jgi:adenylylsulfate kinase-like enzyme
LAGLTGVDDNYEHPSRPELRLDTTGLDPATAARRVLDLLSTG